MRKYGTRTALLKWEQYLELARQTVEAGKESITVDASVLLRIAKHIKGLNEMALNNITVVGCCTREHVDDNEPGT
jgi:hypothetical protein